MRQPVPAGLPAAGADDLSRSDPPLRPAPTAVTAFVGRTLKGPVNEPVRVTGFAQFLQQFGGLWQPSTLSYAVDQFFENGGEEALVVRVASAGHPPTLDLPAGDEWLVLAGLAPGSREYLRASVDYDGIEPGDTSHFNLVVQRVRSPGSELVEAQEIFRRVSVADDAHQLRGRQHCADRACRVSGDGHTAKDLLRLHQLRAGGSHALHDQVEEAGVAGLDAVVVDRRAQVFA